MKALKVKNWNSFFENSESRKLKNTNFVPIPNKHDGKGFGRIALHQQSCRVFTGWTLILQVASKMPQRGLLVDEDGALDVDDLAVMTRFDAATFTTAIPVLLDPKIGWLEEVDIPNVLVTSGRNPEEIHLSPDTSHHVPTHPSAPGRREGKGTEGKKKGIEGNTPKSPEGTFPYFKIPDIVALYPRRERTAECILLVAAHIDDGIDPEAIIAGTKAIAAIIPQLPAGKNNAYLIGAFAFFRNQRWEDDPQTWLRQAAVATDRKQRTPTPDKTSLGGFTPTPAIEI